MKVHLQYGRQGLEVTLPASSTDVYCPEHIAGLGDEASAFRAAVREPVASSPALRELISPADSVAVVIPDITRPFPSARVLPWLFKELSHVPAENFTIIIGTGSHRANTPEELAAMVGQKIAEAYRIVNHDAYHPDALMLAGKTDDGRHVMMNSDYVRADKRIILGFIEPHFMAGFSGGYKAVFPGLVDIDSIMHYHRASVIGDERSTWGVMEGNPTQEQIRAGGALLPVDFCINVTLNRNREITRFFCGDVIEAHRRGCAFAKSAVMVPCKRTYPVVITTNSGYPLDQNLYQSVKGMSAAAQIVDDGGLIVAACRCNDGFPDHGNFRKLLFEHSSPQKILDTVLAPGFSLYDQWEAQVLAIILIKARVALYSELAPQEVRQAHLEPVDDIDRFVAEEVRRLGGDVPIAVLPEGPMTIPYLESRP